MFCHHKDRSIPSGGDRRPNPIQRLLERLRALGAALRYLGQYLTADRWGPPEELDMFRNLRRPGNVVIQIHDKGEVIVWSCSGPAGVVTPESMEALARDGWRRSQPHTSAEGRKPGEPHPSAQVGGDA